MGLDKANESAYRRALRGWGIPVVLLILGLSIQLFGEVGREWLRYDRVWLQYGESWLGWQHFVLNGCGLILVWYLVGDAFPQRVWLTVIALIVATIDAAFWFLNPELYWYVGLSGLLHGLLAAGLVRRLPALDGETVVLMLLPVFGGCSDRSVIIWFRC